MTKDTINFPEHVAQWKESGLSMAAYCKEQGFNYQTFTYHALRIRKKETISADANTFVQLKVPEKVTAGIEYHFPSGGYFVFPAGCSIQQIKSLIG